MSPAQLSSPSQIRFSGLIKPGKVTKSGTLIITKDTNKDVVHNGDIIIQGAHIKGKVISNGGQVTLECATDKKKNVYAAQVDGLIKSTQGVDIDGRCQADDIDTQGRATLRSIKETTGDSFYSSTTVHSASAHDVKAGSVVLEGGALADHINSNGAVSLQNLPYYRYSYGYSKSDMGYAAARAGDITAMGKVTLAGGTSAENIDARDTVTLHSEIKKDGSYQYVTGATAKNIKSGANVMLDGGSVAKDIEAEGKVDLASQLVKTGSYSYTVSGAKADNIKAHGPVTLQGGVTVDKINCGSNVTLNSLKYNNGYDNTWVGSSAKEIRSGQNVTLHPSTKAAAIYADGNVRLMQGDKSKNGCQAASAQTIMSFGTVTLEPGAYANYIETEGQVVMQGWKYPNAKDELPPSFAKTVIAKQGIRKAPNAFITDKQVGKELPYEDP